MARYQTTTSVIFAFVSVATFAAFCSEPTAYPVEEHKRDYELALIALADDGEEVCLRALCFDTRLPGVNAYPYFQKARRAFSEFEQERGALIAPWLPSFRDRGRLTRDEHDAYSEKLRVLQPCFSLIESGLNCDKLLLLRSDEPPYEPMVGDFVDVVLLLEAKAAIWPHSVVATAKDLLKLSSMLSSNSCAEILFAENVQRLALELLNASDQQLGCASHEDLSRCLEFLDEGGVRLRSGHFARIQRARLIWAVKELEAGRSPQEALNTRPESVADAAQQLKRELSGCDSVTDLMLKVADIVSTLKLPWYLEIGDREAIDYQRASANLKDLSLYLEFLNDDQKALEFVKRQLTEESLVASSNARRGIVGHAWGQLIHLAQVRLARLCLGVRSYLRSGEGGHRKFSTYWAGLDAETRTDPLTGQDFRLLHESGRVHVFSGIAAGMTFQNPDQNLKTFDASPRQKFLRKNLLHWSLDE